MSFGTLTCRQFITPPETDVRTLKDFPDSTSGKKRKKQKTKNKNLPDNAGYIRDVGLIPGSGKSTGGRHSNPLHYPYPVNSMDRGAWQPSVPGVGQSLTCEANSAGTE